MKASRFVCGSSVLLAAWLGATFFNDVPSQRYPLLDKVPPTAGVGGAIKSAILADKTGAMTLPGRNNP